MENGDSSTKKQGKRDSRIHRTSRDSRITRREIRRAIRRDSPCRETRRTMRREIRRIIRRDRADILQAGRTLTPRTQQGILLTRRGIIHRTDDCYSQRTPPQKCGGVFAFVQNGKFPRKMPNEKKSNIIIDRIFHFEVSQHTSILNVFTRRTLCLIKTQLRPKCAGSLQKSALTGKR